MRMFFAIWMLAALFTGAAWAELTTYQFGCITNNSPAQCATGEEYLLLDVVGMGDGFNFGTGGTATTDALGTQVLFRLYLGSLPDGVTLSIADVYFYDGALLDSTMSQLFATDGVQFSPPAVPENLPGWNNSTTLVWSADSDSPPVANGVNASGESLGLLFSLQTGKTFQNVLDDLDSGDLRVGLHVQSISPGGGSEGFITGPPVPPQEAVPEPGPLQLVAIGMGLVAAARWYRRRHAHSPRS